MCPVAAGTMSPSITCGTNVARNSLLVKIIREIEILKLLVVNVVLFTGVGAPRRRLDHSDGISGSPRAEQVRRATRPRYSKVGSGSFLFH